MCGGLVPWALCVVVVEEVDDVKGDTGQAAWTRP
jgi:hypothetical protein